MRTLKKSLALVLALVMVLGLGVVGASADNKLDSYTDAGKIGDAYVEAVGVLTGLGIVDGRTDTEIVPEATYNRAEAAKIIAYMLLGKDQADALKATVAPFEDVSVDFWAAGYIAYCAELGIISGMTETTFEPYGTLTGYQWAKMLLVAVGYGKNGEFEGDSWSLNTATVVAKTGLNEGDLAAADHVALRREQAMLFAFNALNLKQVTYSPNSTNYVYDIWGYVFADGTGTTLGEEVYDLAKVEGQIIDNEGMGNDNTVIKNVAYTGRWGSPAREVVVDANTGIDLMYHAVRVWYTEGKTNTNVYVNDLAETTVYECLAKEDGDDAAEKADKTADVQYEKIGNQLSSDIYEAYLIDNRALDLADDYAYVYLYASFGKLGYAGSKTTNIGGEKVDNDLIMSDISDIEYNSGIVYYKAVSTKDSTDCAWYVLPVSTTEGTISKISQDANGHIVSLTLGDGTVIPVSVFFYAQQKFQDKYILGQQYTFVLDSHGDVIYATKDYSRDLYYYTGDYSPNYEWGDWSSDRNVYNYRFYNVTTGEEYIVPMAKDTDMLEGGYYDVRVTPTAKGLYVADLVKYNENPYAEQYVLDNFWAYTGADSSYAQGDTLKSHTVYFNLDTLTFHVVSGSGKNMTRTTYNGISELAEDYDISTTGFYRILNACFTVSSTETGHKHADVVFFAADDLISYSKYVFIPKDVPANLWSDITGDGYDYYVSYNGAYLDGEKITVSFNAKDKALTDGKALERGFYTYVSNGNQKWLVGRVEDGEYCRYENVYFTDTGDGWGLNGHPVAENYKIVDLTGENEEFTISSLHQYMVDFPNTLKLAYTLNLEKEVAYVYVVSAGWRNTVTMKVDEDLADDWIVVDPVKNDVRPTHGNSFDLTYTVKYVGDDHTFKTGDKVTFELSTDYKPEVTAKAENTFDVVVHVTNADWDNIEFTLEKVTVKVNAIGHEYANAKVQPASVEVGKNTTVKVVLTPVGDAETFSGEAYDITVNVAGTSEKSFTNVAPVNEGKEIVLELPGCNSWTAFNITVTSFGKVEATA